MLNSLPDPTFSVVFVYVAYESNDGIPIWHFNPLTADAAYIRVFIFY